MQCAGCGKPVGAAWLVTGPTLNERVRPRRVALLGGGGAGIGSHAQLRPNGFLVTVATTATKSEREPMNDQLAAPRATETQAPPSNRRHRYTFAELSGVISLSALFCGLAYDGAYFSEIEPRFFHLLSLHDHIDSAISFLPLTLLMLLIGSVHSKLFMDIEDRQKSLVAIIAYHCCPVKK